jgi:hypothetical protein
MNELIPVELSVQLHQALVKVLVAKESSTLQPLLEKIHDVEDLFGEAVVEAMEAREREGCEDITEPWMWAAQEIEMIFVRAEEEASNSLPEVQEAMAKVAAWADDQDKRRSRLHLVQKP